jgi:epsilon-lactone hydrolase
MSAQSPQMHAIVTRLRDNSPPTAMDALTHRARLAAVPLRPPDVPIDLDDLNLDGIPAERLTPRGPTRATVIYLHHGGFVAGSAASCRHFAARLAVSAGVEVLVPSYRLAPEHPFPAAIEDSAATYRYVLAQHGNEQPVVLAGISAGAGLAVSAMLLLRDQGCRLPRCAVLLSPWADLTLSSAAMTAPDSGDPTDSLRMSQWAARDYLGQVPPETPLASPVFAQLEHLPPLHIEVGTAERFLDDARALAARSAVAGVLTELQVIDGAIHGFPQNAPDTPEGQAALRRIAHFITRHIAEAS